MPSASRPFAPQSPWHFRRDYKSGAFGVGLASISPIQSGDMPAAVFTAARSRRVKSAL